MFVDGDAPEHLRVVLLLPSVFVHFDAQRVVTGIDISNGRVLARCDAQLRAPFGLPDDVALVISSRPGSVGASRILAGCQDSDLVFGTCDRLAP